MSDLSGSSRTTDGTGHSAQVSARAGRVSVIIPVAPGDTAWKSLLPELGPLAGQDEILIVGTMPEPEDFRQFVASCRLAASVMWQTAARGRAVQMNHGARASSGKWLWFLHADSRIEPHAIEELQQSLVRFPDALHYFRLRFLQDGPPGMRLNELGVWLRSGILKMPFGDQGFCLRREQFASLGGYLETAAYGEDHLLVWAARRRRISLRQLKSAVRTSARKYRHGGWMPTTVRHLVLTFAQAAPQFLLLLRERLTGRTANIPGTAVRQEIPEADDRTD